jgi:hypothetical protein
MRQGVSRGLLYATAFAMLAATGVAHGVLTDRWPLPGASAAPLTALPMTIGDWDGSAGELDPEVLARMGEGEALLRTYVNRVNGAVVTIFLSAGRAGPIVASHRPESCYPGAGYAFAEPITRRSLSDGSEGPPQEFDVATFSKTERASPIHVRVFWSWSATGHWQIPTSPRLAFAGKRRVCKLYVIRQLVQSKEPLDGDPAQSFLEALIPEMNKSYFAQ